MDEVELLRLCNRCGEKELLQRVEMRDGANPPDRKN